MSSPQAWREFFDRYDIELVLMENLPMKLETTRLYPDGSSKIFKRPYYALFMPKDRWALAHWDRRALIFVRRDAASPAWLRAHEYRFVRPGDEEALQDGLDRREIPRKQVDAERERHQQKSAEPDRFRIDAEN